MLVYSSKLVLSSFSVRDAALTSRLYSFVVLFRQCIVRVGHGVWSDGAYYLFAVGVQPLRGSSRAFDFRRHVPVWRPSAAVSSMCRRHQGDFIPCRLTWWKPEFMGVSPE